MSSKSNSLKVRFVDKEIDVKDLDDPLWDSAEKLEIGTYWSGEQAPAGRHFTAQLLWSRSALYVRFIGVQDEPLIVADKPDLTKKSIGMWDRDVSEIFIAPNQKTPNKYFEFEVAPNGEWVDLGIEVVPGKRITDWKYSSGMSSAAQAEKNKVISAIKVEWKALGKTPRAGDKWRGNLFRCIGKDPVRGYLAWQPTMTKEPAFHVPDKFGWFEFVR
jgi:hypothetical protein